MENASKALIIAGGILISILVISLLVMFYNNIKDLMGTEHNVDMSEQALEFNKQYDVYYRDNLYGSDILSVANKVNDYNIRQAEEQGYKEIEMTITFNSDIKIRDQKDGTKLETAIAKGSIWDSKKLQDLIENKTDGWDTVISKLAKKDIKRIQVKLLIRA